MARTVRVRARRVLGAAGIIGGATALCLVVALSLTRSGNSNVASYHRPASPPFHAATDGHQNRTNTVGNSQPPHSSGVGGLPAPSTPSIPAQPSIPPQPSDQPSIPAQASDLPSDQPSIPNLPSHLPIPNLPIPNLPSDLPIPNLPISLGGDS